MVYASVYTSSTFIYEAYEASAKLQHIVDLHLRGLDIFTARPYAIFLRVVDGVCLCIYIIDFHPSRRALTTCP